MKFIQDKINAVGKVNYAAYWHNNADNTGGTNQFSVEVTNLVANPSDCRVSYHFKSLIDGKTSPPFDRDAWFSLREVQDLIVRTGEQYQKKVNTDGGYPAIEAKIDPPIFVLGARKSGSGESQFMFRDEDMANRVAKALVHAVELCGGGGKPEPF
jgi:hypothetical protein